MELITDVTRGDWLLARAGEFATFGGVAGTGFEAYARILHPLRADREDRSTVDEYDDHPVIESTEWRWAAVAERTRRTIDPLVSWQTLSGRDDESDLSFEDGWLVHPPETGWYEPTQLAVLTELLADATLTPDDLVGAVWDGWGDLNASTLGFGWQGNGEPTAAERVEMQAHMARAQAQHRREQAALRESLAGPRFPWPARDCLLLSMSLQQLGDPSWMDDARVGTDVGVEHTPQMLWPEGHEWVLATEIDWDSTIVAGTRSLVDTILADHRFEAYEVDAEASPG
ncbi:hypothetical protein NYS52_14280 [Curtobacterium flaccumfaciens pv. flaccumfaciens]|uniref:hypothetical protein n=1 Tax=Curtobacterium poinsettiae TaxID=159612 RepID=UPI00217DC4B6|nr:hypothetical protein [Curtobacterium flaccumfaciens]MCS6575698.1 hypothetical protein [Curtobacterium flaccumfaciens pv. flaccumfaciens]